MQKLKIAIYTLVLVLLGGAGAVFSVCYFAEIDTGFIAKFRTALKMVQKCVLQTREMQAKTVEGQATFTL